MAKDKAAKKVQFQVVGIAMTKNERDIRVNVRAATAELAKAEAIKEEPSLEKHKDVRIYKRSAEWIRVL